MGAPSQQQIEDAIAAGLARGEDEDAILAEVSSLTRLADEELATMGIGPAPERNEVIAPPKPDAALVPVKHRHDGWTAERQRAFLAALAETGCVSEACAEVGITPRSAYRLRDRPDAKAFRLAWIHAQSLAVTRLTAIAFERAIHGSTEQFYRDGQLVAERRKPSDRLLMFLLRHFDPVGFGWMEGKPVAPEITDPRWDAIGQLPKAVRKLRDMEPDACPLEPISPGDLIDSATAA